MAFRPERFTLTTTAQRVDPEEADGNIALVLIPQAATAAIILGDENVTSATGARVPAGESITVQRLASEKLYALVAAGTLDVDVLAQGA